MADPRYSSVICLPAHALEIIFKKSRAAAGGHRTVQVCRMERRTVGSCRLLEALVASPGR